VVPRCSESVFVNLKSSSWSSSCLIELLRKPQVDERMRWTITVKVREPQRAARGISRMSKMIARHTRAHTRYSSPEAGHMVPARHVIMLFIDSHNAAHACHTPPSAISRYQRAGRSPGRERIKSAPGLPLSEPRPRCG
jgi:hypothetical protein